MLIEYIVHSIIGVRSSIDFYSVVLDCTGKDSLSPDLLYPVSSFPVVLTGRCNAYTQAYTQAYTLDAELCV